MMTDDRSRELSGAVNQSPAPVLGAGAREALEPFAKAWMAYGDKPSDETRLSNNRDAAWLEGTLITFGDLRRAYEAYALADTVTDTAQGQPEITKGVRRK